MQPAQEPPGSQPAALVAATPSPAPAADAAPVVASPSPAADPALVAALDRLVRRAVLSRGQADAVLAEVGAAPAAAPTGRRRILAEIAGYLGAAFVVGATALYLGQEWERLGRGGRFTVLAAMTAVLAVSGLVIRLRDRASGRAWWHGRPADDVRRRLASTLFTGAAIAAGFAAHVALRPAPEVYDNVAENRAWLLASAVTLLVAAAGYLAARSAVGQLGAAAAAFALVMSCLAIADVDDAGAFGVAILLLGLAWVALAWLRVYAERRFGLGIAVALALAGAQTIVAGGGSQPLGYVLTAAVAAGCFAGYARTRDWVLLAGGVVGATLVVPEFLYDVTDGSLGAAGVMLAAGVTLLAASLAGLRIRRTAPEPPDGPSAADGDDSA